MCGIFGQYNFNKAPVSTTEVEEMGAIIGHRGPDDRGHHIHDHMAIGNMRLSIIDLAHGHQPFLSPDGKISVVQNGEIYNYKELMIELEGLGVEFQTHSDTEVLLHGYMVWGKDFVNKLNGMFAIAIYDENIDTMLIYRDRMGVKPLYYYQSADRLIFGSEIKSILKADIPRECNLDALHHFLSFNYVPIPLTMFKNILHLEPGCMAEVTSAGISIHRWWNLADLHENEGLSDDQTADIQSNILDILDQATEIRLRSDVEVGAFLSGGIDSSAVVGNAIKHLDRQLRTFSIYFEDKRFDESVFAIEAAERFGTNHIGKTIRSNMIDLWPKAIFHCDQPHGDVSFMPTYKVAELASEHLKVVLTGDGADELFAGYTKYTDFAAHPSFGKAGWHREFFEYTSLLQHDDKIGLYSPELQARFSGHDSFDFVKPFFDLHAGKDDINQMLAFDSHYLLSGNNLVKPDRMGMAKSIEARNPFMDYRMVEYAFSLPGHMKMRGDTTKYILKQAVCDLIGENLTYRKKQMFTVPIGEWFKDSLLQFTKDVLLSDRFAARGLFNPQLISTMIDDHATDKANHTRILRALIAIEFWFRMFIDDPSLHCPDLEELVHG
jgi:asparagine synthase (glutamine-hydrolysing)